MTLRSTFCLSSYKESGKKNRKNWFERAVRILNQSSLVKESSLESVCERLLGNVPRRTISEAVSGTTNTSALVKSTESKAVKFEASVMRESATATQPQNKFRVILIEEGLGNFGSAHYYTRECLEAAVPLFTGLKIMADHPSLEEEEIRPERSTRDILGHYENISVEEAEGGRVRLCGDAHILPSQDCDWARARMIRAIENASKFPDKPFVGLSINAWGDSEESTVDEVLAMAPEAAKAKVVEAKENGIELVRVVRRLKGAVSCDLVTEAGAGGTIINIIGDKEDGKEKAG